MSQVDSTVTPHNSSTSDAGDGKQSKGYGYGDALLSWGQTALHQDLCSGVMVRGWDWLNLSSQINDYPKRKNPPEGGFFLGLEGTR